LDFDVVLVAPERLGLEAGSRDSAAAWRRIKADRSASVRNQKRPVPAPAPVRRFLPELIEKIWTRQINPGKVFDLTLPLEKAAEGYAAMDDRTAIKVLLQP
jgi:hypothetical protein